MPGEGNYVTTTNEVESFSLHNTLSSKTKTVVVWTFTGMSDKDDGVQWFVDEKVAEWKT